MDKKSKEALRRYKKSRQQASSSDSSSSDSDSSSSYSSSDSEQRHRKKKSLRRDSSSEDERRKREKREHCQKKLEAKKNHLKRKLKAAKLKKRAAAAAAALTSHSYRALSPATQAKLKKIAERDKLRAASKEHREREKHRAREREREHHRATSRSPTKITKIRIHQDVKRQKSPPRMHHQLMSREKIIIQARTRDRTPSAEREARQRHEHKIRHEDIARERERRERDRERAEREAARDKERAEALARCQERQRERERLAREKLRREEEEKKYGGSGASGSSERLLQRPSEREIGIGRGYGSRERSIEGVERARHMSKRDIDMYDRDQEYIETDRRGIMEREDIRRDHREYMPTRRREITPVAEQYGARIRDPRDLYPEEERERPFKRGYVEDPRDRDAWMDPRDLRERGELHKPRDYNIDIEPELMYSDERDRLLRERKIPGRVEWKEDWQLQRDHEWDDAGPPGRTGFVGGPKRGAHNLAGGKLIQREKRAPSETDWDANDTKEGPPTTSKVPIAETQREWIEHDQREIVEPHPKAAVGPHGWQMDWREGEEPNFVRAPHMHMHHRSERGGRGGFRRGGMLDHGERNPQGGGFRPHPPPLMNIPIHPPGGFHGNPRFPHKRPMMFGNPNIVLRKQQAVLAAAAKAAAQASAVAAATTAVAAAKAAAQSAANATTNPGILAQVSGTRTPAALDEKPEAGEIVTKTEIEKPIPTATTAAIVPATAETTKTSGELSEISDSEDDILNKTEKKTKAEAETETGEIKTESPPVTDTKTATAQEAKGTAIETAKAANVIAVLPIEPQQSIEKEDDEEMLDFEEISDGELEEEARHKGVGDALGVDWASLIAETKRQAEESVPNPNEQTATAKQRWQPHRVILDIGISMRMAGESYAKSILQDAKQKLDEELEQLKIKREIKAEVVETDENTTQSMETETNKPTIQLKTEDDIKTELTEAPKTNDDNYGSATINVDKLHPMACIQVAERRRQWTHQKLIANACGPNSRALSARHDLQLRRQLCGLPARECNLPRPIPATSEKLKTMAVAAFQRALEVK